MNNEGNGMEGKQNWKHWICFLVAVSIVQVLFSQLADKLFLLLDLFAVVRCSLSTVLEIS